MGQTRLSAALLCTVLCAAFPACNFADGTVRHLMRTGVQGAAEGISTNDAELRQAIRDLLLKDNLLDQITQKTIQSVTGQLTSPEQQAHFTALTSAMMEVLRQQGDAAVDHYLKTAGAQVEQTVQHIAADSLKQTDEILKQLLHKDIQEASELLIKRNAEVLATVIAAQLQGPLGQSLQLTSKQLTHQVLGEATQTLRDKETQEAVREFLRATTREAVAGATEGLRDELRNSPTHTALIAGLISLGTLLLVIFGVLGFFIRQYLVSTKVLSLVAQKINESSGDNKQLKQAIFEKARNHNVEHWLSDFLHRRGL